ncbi:non-muscle caldesmon isoform X1 [Oncorhynchus tshawytscha]|uniref:non-muscle caldesmon isoform X1 n=1 Tax=Oncorhynchus tshawytscha TaxID=74940 RepID=UPI000D09ED31|nr:non-muscle caldesmon isoform X1 [Oncorhynchus tshawytscha]XP_024228776.1 non-muscle caldesmon isoform X1 [Oncorhynchus tshawytscha]XP_024228777.1 non-muscle caldesmon isoform X1 [Oncorhynchus tshawytscha]
MDDDFERRRELRRQKREEMRLEAERLAFQGSNEDEEEAARERRRRARQERMRGMGGEEPSDSVVMTNSHSVTETVSVSSSSMTSSGGGDDDEQALLERMAKREERRQKRLMEALEREKDQNPGNDGNHGSGENTVEERSVGRRGRYQDNEDEVEERNCRKEEEGEAAPEEEEAEQGEEEADEEVVEEEKPRQSYMREQESIDVNTRNEEDTEEQAVVLNEVEESEAEVEENAALSDKVEEEVEEPDQLEVEGTTVTLNNETEEDCRMSTIQNGLDVVNEKQNGGLHEETPQKHKKTERTLSRGSVRSPAAGAEEQDDTAPLEAELKLEELKRRRDDAESEEFERMRRKQQEAEQELEELKKKREERRKIIEEEERQKKQEEAEKKDREEEEKRRMKEEIERRRAEAAEKRQQMGVETVDAEAKPFKCFSPRGSSLKIGERAEFLSKSAQKSMVKSTHSPVVSKIDNRLEQYTSVAQNKDMRSPRSGAVDLPMVTDGIRNIKSMWEKGSVFNSPGGGGGTYKEAAGMKIGVAGRINDWLNKTPESKTPGGRPADLKPGDVTNKRSLWENKGSSPAKVTGRGENKSVANAGMGHE